MAFEKFTKKGRGYKPKLSIRNSGQIGLNMGAVKKYSLEKYIYAVLYYDKDNNLIGIRPTNESEEGACTLRVRQRNASIAAKSFLDYYDIDYKRMPSNRFETQFDEENNMIIADITRGNKNDL